MFIFTQFIISSSKLRCMVYSKQHFISDIWHYLALLLGFCAVHLDILVQVHLLGRSIPLLKLTEIQWEHWLHLLTDLYMVELESCLISHSQPWRFRGLCLCSIEIQLKEHYVMYKFGKTLHLTISCYFYSNSTTAKVWLTSCGVVQFKPLHYRD